MKYVPNRGPEPYEHLPLPAKCAIEFLDCQGYGNRSIAKLDAYLDHYYKTYGQVCDEHTRYSCHHIAIKRFMLVGDDAEGDLSATDKDPGDIITVPEGHNGATIRVFANPIDTIGDKLKLRVATPGNQHLATWISRADYDAAVTATAGGAA